jgi:D-lactate dehydrogenase
MPAVNDKIDLCVECGFCEPVCPSRGFTFTPRQRIGVSRELKTLSLSNSKISKQLKNDYVFNTEMTCAVDGMCESVCPVNINTGEFVKDLRHQSNSTFANLIAKYISNHFLFTTKSIKFAVNVLGIGVKVFSAKLIDNSFSWMNKVSKNKIPAWNSMINSSDKTLRKSEFGDGDIFVYYPSCISRAFGADLNKQSIIEVMQEIAELTEIKLVIPDKIDKTCCSTPFSSKGFHDTGIDMFSKTIDLLYEATEYGKIPIIVDTSPCTYKFLHPSNDISKEINKKWQKLIFVDIIPFLENITKDFEYKPLDKEIILHPTCSTQKMEHTEIMELLAKRCSKKVTIPINSNCCGFAGDRGMIVPKLMQNAVKYNKDQLSSEQRKLNGYSSSRMCEIGMSDSDQSYISIALLVRDFLKEK